MDVLRHLERSVPLRLVGNHRNQDKKQNERLLKFPKKLGMRLDELRLGASKAWNKPHLLVSHFTGLPSEKQEVGWNPKPLNFEGPQRSSSPAASFTDGETGALPEEIGPECGGGETSPLVLSLGSSHSP